MPKKLVCHAKTASVGRWGGGDKLHTKTLANPDNIWKELDLENIQTFGFNNSGFVGCYPA